MKCAPLASVLVSLTSGARPRGGATADSGEIVSVGGEHLTADGRFDFTHIKKIPRSFFTRMHGGRIDPLDILIVKDGATTGKTALADEAFPFKDAAVNEHVFAARVDSRLASPRYICHYLRSPEGQARILSDFRGATVGGISREFAAKMEVPLPSLGEQRQIAEALDAADALRLKRRASIVLLDSLTQSVFVAMFGPDGQYRSECRVLPLGDMCSVVRDGVHKTPRYYPSGVPFVTAKNVVSGTLDLTATSKVSLGDHLEFTKRVKPSPGDVLVTKDGARIGLTCAVTTDREFSIFVSVALLRPKHEVLKQQFLLAQLRTYGLQYQIKQLSKGAAIRHLHLEDFRRLEIAVPPILRQVEFVERVNAIQACANAGCRSLLTLDAMFASIEHRAFRGEL